MDKRIYLNNDWKFSEEFKQEMVLKEYDESTMESVRIPHTCKEIPFHYFDEHMYQMVSGYRRKFEAKEEWKGKLVRI